VIVGNVPDIYLILAIDLACNLLNVNILCNLQESNYLTILRRAGSRILELFGKKGYRLPGRTYLLVLGS
jgi:hypothetical protein